MVKSIFDTENDGLAIELIIADTNGKELGKIKEYKEVDVDIGGENDFQMTMDTDGFDKEKYEFKHRFYIPGTEYGGLLEERKVDTKNSLITWNGYTWRGLLNQKVVEPEDGEDYLIITGEINELISELIGEKFGSVFVVSNENTEIELNNYQVSRYVKLGDAIDSMLSSVGYKLNISYQQSDEMYGSVLLAAEKIEDYSEELEFSSETKCTFTITENRRGINHLICLGQGELAERTVIHLYVQEDGTIGDSKYYYGLDERMETYENVNAEDEEELYDGGVERLEGLMNDKSIDLDIDDVDIDIGDIVGGYEEITETQTKNPVTAKILRISNGIVSIEYTVEGSD